MCGAAAASIISRQPASAQKISIAPIKIIPNLANAAGINGARTKASGSYRNGLVGSTFHLSLISASARNSLVFNAGRIASYVIAGALVAGIASTLAGRIVMHDVMPLRLALFVIGQSMVIATGFYIAGYTKPLAPFERIGRLLWRYIQQWMKPLLSQNQVHGQRDLFLLGAMWGWIPCGMVYAVLITAMASGSAQNGALVMLGFGLGTLPAMFAAGALAIPLRQLAQKPKIRIVAGAIVVALGLFGLSRSVSLANFAVLGDLCTSTIEALISGEKH